MGYRAIENVGHAATDFDNLLRKFSGCALVSTNPPRAAEFESLLKSLEKAVVDSRLIHREEFLANAEHFFALLSDFERQLQILDARKEETADGFNSLAVFGLTTRELCHSRALAWLLDRDPHRFGTHYQQRLGFRLFLEAVGMNTALADHDYTVRTEVASKNSIMDIEVSCHGKFLICIENKIWSSEGCEQTHREWADFKSRAKELGVDHQSAKAKAFFLTPYGTDPKCSEFTVLQWTQIADVLYRFADEAKAEQVRQFARHYADILRSEIALEME